MHDEERTREEAAEETEESRDREQKDVQDLDVPETSADTVKGGIPKRPQDGT